MASVFVSHVPYLRVYSPYIADYPRSLEYRRRWALDYDAGGPKTQSSRAWAADAVSLTDKQRKRIQGWLHKCRADPRHSEADLEQYLIMPIQRLPNYKLLLEQLAEITSFPDGATEDPITQALAKIEELTAEIDKAKKASQSRAQLVVWQSRMRAEFPNPLVQPHRTVVKDGVLDLYKVVPVSPSQSVDADAALRRTVVLLCNDIMLLCSDTSDGEDPTSDLTLWAVLRMRKKRRPAAVMGRSLCVEDDVATLWFNTKSVSEACGWCDAINRSHSFLFK